MVNSNVKDSGDDSLDPKAASTKALLPKPIRPAIKPDLKTADFKKKTPGNLNESTTPVQKSELGENISENTSYKKDVSSVVSGQKNKSQRIGTDGDINTGGQTKLNDSISQPKDRTSRENRTQVDSSRDLKPFGKGRPSIKQDTDTQDYRPKRVSPYGNTNKTSLPKRRRKRLKIPTLKELYTANLHAGNIKRNWNPKMKPFLFDMPQPKSNARRKNIHYFDLVKTRYFLKRAVSSLYRYTRIGHKVLFVGTQINTSKLVKKAALSCGSAYINQKWLGGVLTNWETISASIRTLLDLNRMTKSGKILSYGKKEQARLTKKRLRLIKTIGGLQTLVRQPEVVIIIGQNEEYKAVNECLRMKTHCITILDTDCDPGKAEMYIPANDNVKASIVLILQYLAYSIRQGNKQNQLWEENQRQLEQKRQTQENKNKNRSYNRGRRNRGASNNGTGKETNSVRA